MYKEMMDTIGLVNGVDPEVGAAMGRELARQRENIELIASENIVSPAVMAAMGSVLTNKYAEGLPGKRYYGGCVYVDEVENIAIRRACQLFGAKYANVQPHSGAQANLAVYFALLDLGDTVMGMDLSQGGHLTHGSPVNMSGKNYRFVSYGVGEDGRIDYNEVEKAVKKTRPKMLVAGASAYPRAIEAVCFGEALQPAFREYARKIVDNAQVLAGALMERGVQLVSGGTDNHLMLIDLRSEACTGKELEVRLDAVHITANKNTVPGETRSPFVTSGVRLGTPAVTTRGMGADEMKTIAGCIADCIWDFDEKKEDINARVLALTKQFPLYE